MTHEMDALIDTFLDGDATDAERDRLAAWLGECPSHRDHFVKRSRLHWSLRGLGQRRSIDTAAARMKRGAAGHHDSADEAPLPVAKIEPTPVWSRPGPMLAAAAIVVAACVAVAVYTLATDEEEPTPAGPAFISVIDSTGDLYMGDALGTTRSDYPGGPIELTHGSAEFMLSNRVSVRLSGATRLTMTSPMSVTVHAGQVAFNCPTEASGFTVHLPGGWSVIDRSTAFEVIVHEDGRLGVVVTEGLITLRGPADESVDIVAGQGWAIDRGGRLSEAAQTPWLSWQLAMQKLTTAGGVAARYTFDTDGEKIELSGDAAIGDGLFGGRGLETSGAGHVAISGPGSMSTLTLSAWIRPERLDDGLSGILMSDAWPAHAVHWQIDDAHLKLNVSSVSELRASKPLETGRWQHVAMTFDGINGDALLYVDGERVGKITIKKGATVSIGSASIGGWKPLYTDSTVEFTRGFVGSIDELLILDRALNADEVRALYHAATPRVTTDDSETPE